MTRFTSPKVGKLISRSALGVALALGVAASGTIVTSPAYAAKKGSAPKLNLSKGFIAVAGPAQQAVDGVAEGDAAAGAQVKAQIDQVFSAVENEDDRFMAGSLAVNLGGKLRDPELQRKGLKAMLESGKADAEALPKFYSAAGQLAYQAKDYPEALQYLQQAVDAGVTDPNTMAMLGEAYISANQLDKGLSIFESAIESGRTSGELAPDSWYRRGLLAAYKAQNLDKAAQFGAMLVADYPTSQNVGIATTIVRELGNFQSQETLDLMRLMGRSNSYAEARDYVEYIQAADPRRLPGEVLDVVNAGVASGKLSASDTFVSDAKTQASGRMSADKASLAGYEADARKAGASEATVSGAADALLSYGEAAKAEELYQIAVANAGAEAPKVLTRLGIAQVDQGEYAAAQETFAKVTGKRAPIAKLWAAYAAGKAKPAQASTGASTGASAPASTPR